MQLDEGGEGGIDLVSVLAFRILELHPLRPRRFLHLSDRALVSRIIRVHEKANHPGLRDQLGQAARAALASARRARMLTPGEVAARPGEAGDQAVPRPDRRHWRRRSGSSTVALFAASAGGRTAASDDHVNLAADEIGRPKQAADHISLRPAVFDCHVLPDRRSRSRVKTSDRTRRRKRQLRLSEPL